MEMMENQEPGGPVKIKYKESGFLRVMLEIDSQTRERENMKVKPQQRERGTTEGPPPASLPCLISLQGPALLPPLAPSAPF